MSIIDLGIFLVLSISFLLAMYNGFTISVFNTASFIFSWFLSLIFHSLFGGFIIRHYPDLIEKIIYYSEGSSKLPFSEKILPASELTLEQISFFVNKTNLPNPFAKNLAHNLSNLNLQGLHTLGQYIDYTVANTILNLLSFMLLFFLFQLLAAFVVSLTKNISPLPVLKKFDSLSAGLFGLLRGGLFLFVIFAFVPILYLFIPINFLESLWGGSKLIRFFINANFFTAFIKGLA